jgi:hypothetical protein
MQHATLVPARAADNCLFSGSDKLPLLSRTRVTSARSKKVGSADVGGTCGVYHPLGDFSKTEAVHGT